MGLVPTVEAREERVLGEAAEAGVVALVALHEADVLEQVPPRKLQQVLRRVAADAYEGCTHAKEW